MEIQGQAYSRALWSWGLEGGSGSKATLVTSEQDVGLYALVPCSSPVPTTFFFGLHWFPLPLPYVVCVVASVFFLTPIFGLY